MSDPICATGEAARRVDLDAIERAARVATPGPWKFEELRGDAPDGCGYIRPEDEDGKEIAHHGDMGRPRQDNLANAAHIAGMDPPTVLARTARVRSAEAERDEAKRAYDEAGRKERRG